MPAVVVYELEGMRAYATEDGGATEDLDEARHWISEGQATAEAPWPDGDDLAMVFDRWCTCFEGNDRVFDFCSDPSCRGACCADVKLYVETIG